MKTLIISYPFSWGGQIKDRWMWQGVIEGETDVYDFNSKKQLIYEAINNGWFYKVMKLDRKTRKMVVVHHNLPTSLNTK